MKFEGGKVVEIDREAEEVSIPPTATRICEVACFFGSITSLDLENTQITIIEKHAFANCYNLQEVRFPSYLEEICEGAFKQCEILKHISFPPDSRLLKIGDNAFENCYDLESIEFPHFLEFIGDCAFSVSSSSFSGKFIYDLRETNVRHVGYNEAIGSILFYLPQTVAAGDIVRLSDGQGCDLNVAESHPVVRRDPCGYYFSNGTIFESKKTSRRVLIRRGVERIGKRCFLKSNLVSLTIPSSVTVIDDYAFQHCNKLQHLRFSKESLLQMIGHSAFDECSIKMIKFPKSLKIIKKRAFEYCESLERVIFPKDSQLERIEGAFQSTAIKRLSLPPSVREIVGVSYGMENLESMYVSNDYFQSNEEGDAIFSRDGSELVSVITKLKKFEIPDCVRVIKKRAFYDSSVSSLTIIQSVEVIEEEAFKNCYHLNIIEFEEGSRLKLLAFDAFDGLRDLIINNENFVKMENGVVMSLNPKGIVFVPRELTELEIPPGVEVIYSHAFYNTKINRLMFPKSLKKICSYAFHNLYSSLESITFEEGTELDFIGNFSFNTKIRFLKIPNIKGELKNCCLVINADIFELPQNLELKNNRIICQARNIVCSQSSLSIIANFLFVGRSQILVENH